MKYMIFVLSLFAVGQTLALEYLTDDERRQMRVSALSTVKSEDMIIYGPQEPKASVSYTFEGAGST